MLFAYWVSCVSWLNLVYFLFRWISLLLLRRFLFFFIWLFFTASVRTVLGLISFTTATLVVSIDRTFHILLLLVIYVCLCALEKGLFFNESPIEACIENFDHVRMSAFSQNVDLSKEAFKTLCLVHHLLHPHYLDCHLLAGCKIYPQLDSVW